MKNPNASLFGTNLFAKAFAEFDEEAFFQNLHNKVKNKSYFEKYKGFKNTIVALSYLFNAASIFSASYGVYWLTKWFTGTAVAGYILAAVFLFFLEKLKRKSSNEFFQVWFFKRQTAVGWLCLSFACLGISLGSSSFGTKTGTEELAPDPELIATDSTAAAYTGKIAELVLENQKLSSQTNHEGTIYYKLQDVIRTNTEMIADYNNQVIILDKKLQGKNEQLTETYYQSVQMTKQVLIALTILFEILFESCICYVWYYYYRSYVERTILNQTENQIQSEDSHPLPYSTEEPTSKDDLLDLVLNLRQQLEDLKAETHPVNFPIPENGQTANENSSAKSQSRTHRVYGFLTGEQKKIRDSQLFKEKLSEQTLAELSRENIVIFQDKFTVVHKYWKGNRQKIVRYTLPRIESRLAQYRRELDDAVKKKMDSSIIENRKNWITYWETKKKELEQKMNSPVN